MFSSWASVLLDSGTSHLFISSVFASVLGLESSPLDLPKFIETPVRDRVWLDHICQGSDLTISERSLPCSLF